MVRPSTAAQQSVGPADPTIVTVIAPTPTLVVVESPARSTAVTDVVDTKVRTAWIRRPVIVHVKATSLIPDGGVVVRGGVGATLVDGDGVPDSLGRVVELVPEPAPEVVPAPEEPSCPVEEVEAVAAADDVAALGLGTEVDSAPEWESFGAVDPIEAAALVASVGREPPNNDATPQPASARTIAKIPTAPIRDIDRIPTAPPAPGSRWRPTPGSIVIARQNRRLRPLVERPHAESRTDQTAEVGPLGLEPTTPFRRPWAPARA